MRGPQIVGAYEIPERTIEGTSLLDVFSRAAKGALTDAGLQPGMVDGLFLANVPGSHPAFTLAEHLGIEPRWSDTTRIGGAAPLAHVMHAVSAIETGRCRVALVVYGSLSRSQKVSIGTGGVLMGPNREIVYGPVGVGRYAMFARRHMHEYGTTMDQLSVPAVAARQWAQLNDHSIRKDLLDIPAVRDAPMVADPLTVPMCCVISDGGGAIVVADRSVAAGCPAPIDILGAGEMVVHRDVTSAFGFTETGVRDAAAAAWRESGVSPGDINVCTIYDSFTITVLAAIEDAGFCAKGEAGAFVEEMGLGPGTRFPLNPDGGGLATNHPGMRGIFLIIELVRQLRGGLGARQVPDAQIGAAIGVGGTLDSLHGATTLVLATP